MKLAGILAKILARIARKKAIEKVREKAIEKVGEIIDRRWNCPVCGNDIFYCDCPIETFYVCDNCGALCQLNPVRNRFTLILKDARKRFPELNECLDVRRWREWNTCGNVRSVGHG